MMNNVNKFLVLLTLFALVPVQTSATGKHLLGEQDIIDKISTDLKNALEKFVNNARNSNSDEYAVLVKNLADYYLAAFQDAHASMVDMNPKGLTLLLTRRATDLVYAFNDVLVDPNLSPSDPLRQILGLEL